MDYVQSLEMKELPVDLAKERFSEITGLYDRTTLKAYFGTQKHRSTQKIFRRAFYGGTGTMSNKFIELSQDVATTKGYLEKMGLVAFDLRGKTWFLVVNPEGVLVPQLYRKLLVSESIENISLSPNSSKVASEGSEVCRVVGVSEESDVIELEKTNNLQDEREKLVYKTVYKTLNPQELLILKAAQEVNQIGLRKD